MLILNIFFYQSIKKCSQRKTNFYQSIKKCHFAFTNFYRLIKKTFCHTLTTPQSNPAIPFEAQWSLHLPVGEKAGAWYLWTFVAVAVSVAGGGMDSFF